MNLAPTSQPEGLRRYRFPLAKGDLGIAQTVALMERLIRTGAQDSDVRDHALGIVAASGVSPSDIRGQIGALFQWTKANFQFQPDAHGKEVVGDVRYLLQTRRGDCDDYVVALGALLESVGIPTRVVTIAADRHEPDRFSHTYLQAQVGGGKWVGLDATQAQAFPGWEPPRYYRRAEWKPMMGRFAARRMRWERPVGLGVDWSQLAPGLVQAGENVAAAAASRLAYGPLPPYVYGGVPGPVGPYGAGAAGSLALQSTPGGLAVTGFTGGVGGLPTVVWLAGGLLLVLLLTRK